tara:strand:+ start:276 stop:449 length:174 start_codon:yes stop_codon:yes gene_type:complete
MEENKDKQWLVDQYNRNRPVEEWIQEYIALETFILQLKEIERQNKEKEKEDKKKSIS